MCHGSCVFFYDTLMGLSQLSTVIMEAFRSVIMEAFRDQITTTELLAYKEVLYDEATEEWYAQRDLDEVEREERNCMRLARQLCQLELDWITWQRDYASNKTWGDSRTSILEEMQCKL